MATRPSTLYPASSAQSTGGEPDRVTDDDGHPDETDIDDLATLGVAIGRESGR